jgi:hypothetical protein
MAGRTPCPGTGRFLAPDRRVPSEAASPSTIGTPSFENFAAELTHAVYPIALRIGMRGSWLDLELELWHVLADTVRMWERELPRGR